MRTDVKVGLICAFVLLLAVVAYFAFPTTPKTEPVANTPSKGLTSGTSGKETAVDNAGGTVAVAPPATLPSAPTVGGTSGSPAMLAAGEPTPAPATAPAGGLMIANAGGTGVPSRGSGGGVTPPPATGPSSGFGGGMGGGSLGAPPGNFGSFGAPAGGSTVAGAPTPGGNDTLNISPGAARTGEGTTGAVRPGRRGGLVNTTPPGSVGVPFTPPTQSGQTVSTGKTGGGTATVSGTGGSTYTVVRGDVLTAIARKNHVTLAAIEAANPGLNPNVLKVGAKIHVPAATATAATRPGRTARSGAGATTRPATGARTASGAAKAGSTYVVKKGDTLRKIAKAAYGDENMWRRIARVNRGSLKNPNSLTAGQVLRLPAQ